MFGYVLPNSPSLSARDFSMFQATFCGICIATKDKYGQLARLLTNYDITVLNLLAIEAIKPDVVFTTGRCVADPRKKAYVKADELSSLIVDINILLCYYKLQDDIIDGGGKKRIAAKILAKPYEKAKAAIPECDEIIRVGYEKLRAMEAANMASLDRTSHAFAEILQKLMRSIIVRLRPLAKGSDHMYLSAEERLKDGSPYVMDLTQLCYNIGKFVYLSDAMDDLDEDFGKNRYNPILAVFPDYERGKRREYILKHSKELGTALNSTVNRAIELFNRLPLTHVGALLQNIVYEGLRAKVEELIEAKKKLKPPRIRLSKAARVSLKQNKLRLKKEAKSLKKHRAQRVGEDIDNQDSK